MKLGEYLKRIIEGNGRGGTVPTSIEPPAPLVKHFLGLQEVSEKDGREYGCNLFSPSLDGDLTCGDTVQGTKEDTPLETTKQLDDKSYIGDFHVHPYKLRLHDEASIGPSIGDLQAIVDKRPRHLPAGVYFVLAGPALHLIITSKKTKTDDDIDVRLLTPDFTSLQLYKTEKGVDHKHPFNTKQPQYVSPDHHAYKAYLAREKEAFGHLPGYHLILANANMTMNRQFAAVYDYDYFIGEVGIGGRVTLAAQPRPVWPESKNDSPSTGLICFKCNAVHSRSKSTVIGRWHRCQACWTIYCCWCGDKLWRPTFMSTRERTCDRGGCGGRTELID
ncbi:MAG: hypothetical protein QM820_45190 [Minicystis sp.]